LVLVDSSSGGGSIISTRTNPVQ